MIKLASLYFMFYFTLGGSLLYFSNFFNSIGINGHTSGIIFSVGSLAAMLFQPFIGFVADKTQKIKEILIGLMVLMGTVAIVFYLKQNSSVAFVVFLLYSLSIWGTMPLMDSVSVSTHYPFGKIRLWGSIGFAVGSFTSGKIVSSFGIESFLIVTLVGAIITIGTMATLKKVHVKEHEKTHLGDIVQLMKNSKYMIFIIFTILILGSLNGHNTFFSLYFSNIGGSSTYFGVVVFLLTLSEVPFMNLAANFVTKYGTKKVLVVAGALHFVRWGIYYFFPHPNVVAISFFIQGASTGIFFAVAATHIKTIVSKKTISTAMTTFMAAGTLGGTILQYISGDLVDDHGVKSIYLMFFILSIAGTIIFALNRNTKIEKN